MAIISRQLYLDQCNGCYGYVLRAYRNGYCILQVCFYMYGIEFDR